MDIICSSKLTVFLELRSQKNCSLLETEISTDKYVSICSRQMEVTVYIFSRQREAIVFVILQIFAQHVGCFENIAREYHLDNPQF